MARQKPEKIYHIAVVGMSGTETERGATGVGKSCLCNRFMNPHQDKYFTDHISVISSSDFSGRIVNNDHFLYWGECTKKYDGDTMTFRVVEQTEFIDDSSFSPLRGSNTHPYYKRAAVTKLQSAEKVMYICKDQVGDETNFPQKILPDGKFPVDGYLIIYDVSRSPGHEKQIDWLTKLQGQLHKAKRPVVVVAAKYDEAWDQYVRDAKAFAMKIKAPLIETSSQEGVNVDLAFATIASKIDKRGGPKELPFTAGNEQRQKLITRAVDEYESMLKLEVTNYHDLWTSRKKQYQNRDVFRKVVELIGTKNAKNYFTRHTQRLRQNHQQNKMKLYLGRLPDALESTFPDLKSISGRDWTECRMLLPQMAHFEEWFIILPQDQTWRESEYIDTDELRIPYDLLEGYEVECENCFQDHVNRLNAAKRKERMKAEFKKLLESLPNIVLPFRSMDEDVVMEAISNHESYKELDESTKIAIYNVHQEDIQARAQSDFIELLIEKYALLARVDITQKPSKEVEKLVKQLEHEPRWQKLSEMSLERYIMLIKQLAFVHNPTTDSCYYGEKCMEKLTQCCIERTVQKSPIKELGTWDDSSNRLNIVVIGEDGLADELDTEIKSQSYDGDYTLDKVLYSLELKTIEGNITHPGNQLQTESFTPQGCICVFTSLEGFQYVRDCLERTILSDREEYNSSTLRDLAVVLMFGRSTSPEADTAQVREQADKLCSRLNNCQIVNVPPDNTNLWQGKKFSESQIQDALRSVVAGQKYRSGTPNQAESDRGENGDNAFRIGLCMTCGDPFQPDLVLSPITSHNFMATPNEKNCITSDLFLIDTKCRVDFEISSYHLSESLRDQRVHHGYILVYAAQRKASLEMLRWFMKLVEPIPTLVVAVCEDINSAADGIAEGQRLVDGTATAKLVTANCSSFREQTVIYNSFLKEAHRKRKETEKLYKADEITNRPPMELPSPSRDVSVDDAQTPTSGVEDQLYDEIGHQQSRWAPKPSNEARMYHTANYESRQRRWGSEVRRKPNLPLPSTPQSTGTEDSFHPPSPTKPKVKPKPPVRSSSRKQEYSPGLYGVVNKPAKSPKPKVLPKPDAVYGVVNKPKKSPKPSLSTTGSELEGITGTAGMWKKADKNLGNDDVYATVDKQRKPTEQNPSPDDPPSDALYSEVNKGFKTSTPDTNRSLEGSGMVDNVLYESYTSQKSPAPSGMVDNVLYASYSSQMSPASQTGDSMTYASVQDHRASEDPNGGMLDNILYAPYTPPAESRSRQPPPPTAPKPGKLDLSKFPVRMEGLIRPMGSVNRPNDLPVWHHRRTPAQNNHPPPFASPESDEGAGYASPADALPYDQVRKVIGSSFRTGSSGGGGPQSGIYSQPHDHLPRGTVQKISYGKPMVAFPPRPSGLPFGNDSTPEALSADISRSRETPRQTPVKRPLGTVDARNKKREDFLKGLNKLIEDSMDSSVQDEPNTPRDNKPKPKKPKVKGKKKGQPLVPKKPVKPALEMLMVTENGVPSFIEQCVEKIEEEGLTQEGIYRVSGKAADIETIIKMFDEDQNADLVSLENLSSNTIASALKQFFKNLPEPIIPYSTQDRMIADYKEVNNEDLFVERLPEYLVGLSQVKKTVLTYMMKHMKRITQCSEENLMTAENLSICWWPSMLHPQSKSFDDLANEALLAAVFKLIVEHSETLFDFFT
ncbi:rho GTPase-activating protein 5-like isoform X15 [Lytechinus pictus]|uniref:rho GTPase-activating protein 5-like isoform X15 n=1 Tax=Lytechinus pictus TaxID=7653 RepID=UPI0030B9BD92